MVRNVVAPATNSVRTLVPCSVKLEGALQNAVRPCRGVAHRRSPAPSSCLAPHLQHSDARAAAHQALAEFNSELDIARCGTATAAAWTAAGALHHGPRCRPVGPPPVRLHHHISHYFPDVHDRAVGLYRDAGRAG